MSDLRDGAGVRFDPTVPLHHQVYVHLRQQILDGLWLDRTDFPGERELADELGVSVITSRAALDRLNAEGLIERRRGRRARIIHRPQPAGPREQPGMFPVGRGRPYRYEVLWAETRIAPAEACQAFGLPPGSELWQCSRLRRYEGAAHSVTHNAQRPELGERHTKKELREQPMVALLQAKGHRVARMRRRIGIAHAPKTVTEALGLTIAETVLVCTFTLHDAADEIIQWVRIYVHPDHSTPEETMDLITGTWSAAAPI